MKSGWKRWWGADAEDMWVGTFHSVCVRILRRDIEKIGYKRSFTIYDDDDQLRVIKDVLKSWNIDDKSLPPKEIRGEDLRRQKQAADPGRMVPGIRRTTALPADPRRIPPTSRRSKGQ